MGGSSDTTTKVVSSTSEYSIAIRIDKKELFQENKEIIRAEKTSLTNLDTITTLCQSILREYIGPYIAYRGCIRVLIKRYLPMFKNSIEFENDSQQSFEDYLNGIASDPNND